MVYIHETCPVSYNAGNAVFKCVDCKQSANTVLANKTKNSPAVECSYCAVCYSKLNIKQY